MEYYSQWDTAKEIGGGCFNEGCKTVFLLLLVIIIMIILLILGAIYQSIFS
jgi:hypothetical protein